MSAPEKLKVMLVDDSALLRQVLSAALNADPRLQVVATANDPIAAQERMKSCWPDVIVLDVEMPRMDGLTFLRQIMAERPTPVVICSTLTANGAATTLEALGAGAVAFVTKPTLGLRDFIDQRAAELCRTVAEAGRTRPRQAAPATGAAPAPPAGAARPLHLARALTRTTEQLVAVGASTGGTQALQAVLQRLPRTGPGMVVVQHMPATFTAHLARQLDLASAMEVREAVDGDRVHGGLVLLAPGGRHMALRRDGAHYRVEVFDAPAVNRHRPSVDVLLRSVAQCAGANAMGIILTGMGADGARGLQAMHQAGAHTVAQDEESCVVFGMPKAAIELGAVDQIKPIGQIASDILRFQRQRAT